MKTYEHVYHILSKSPDFVTGESLAKSLGVSRTAIWKAIQTLQEQGIDITSVRKKGYYLEKGDILLPQDISKQLNIPVYFNPDSNSTQLDAKHGMEKNNPTPALYLASSQKAAKGRFERHFFASPQGGIYMSIHLKPNCHFEELPPYTMMAAAAIVKAIQRLTGINTEIKWVNDIYIEGKKVCGILTEAAFNIETSKLDYAIVGIGINVCPPEGGFPEDISEIATAIFEKSSDAVNKRSILVGHLLNYFMEYYESFDKRAYLDEYISRSMIIGQPISVLSNGTSRNALALEIDKECHLKVRYEDGSEEWLNSGEVSTKIQK